MTELHFAAYCGDPDLLEKGLRAGLDPNAKDTYRGYTPLHWLTEMAAAGGPRVEMLQRLLDGGADATIRDNANETALDLAREAGTRSSVVMVEILERVTRGSDV